MEQVHCITFNITARKTVIIFTRSYNGDIHCGGYIIYMKKMC